MLKDFVPKIFLTLKIVVRMIKDNIRQIAKFERVMSTKAKFLFLSFRFMDFATEFVQK